MREELRKKLDCELGCKGLEDVARQDGYYVCELKDKEMGKDFRLCIAFSRLHDIDPEMINVEGHGGVIVVPSFWINIPKELALPYFEKLIDTFYSEYGYSTTVTVEDPPEPPPPIIPKPKPKPKPPMPKPGPVGPGMYL